jgi:hypothetical protein
MHTDQQNRAVHEEQAMKAAYARKEQEAYAAKAAGAGAVMGGYSFADLKPAREMSGLDHSLSGLGNTVAEPDAALEQLEQRLHSVLRPIPPQPAGGGQNLSQVNPVQSPVVDRLQSERQRLERLICHVNQMAARFD